MEDNNCVYIDFVIENMYMDTDILSNVDKIDACCQLSAEIASTGLRYGTDFWFHEAFAGNGEYVLKFGFKDKHEAMIVKLAGISPAYTLH